MDSPVSVMIDGSACDIESFNDTAIICVTNEHRGSIKTQVNLTSSFQVIVLYVFLEKIKYKKLNWPVNSVDEHFPIDAGDLGFDSRRVKSDAVSSTVRHRCDVPLELCC